MTDGVQHVDVDAISHIPGETIGLAALLRETWERYGLPVAVTESHLGGTRENQEPSSLPSHLGRALEWTLERFIRDPRRLLETEQDRLLQAAE